MAACNVDFDNAVKYALNVLKPSDLVLKREQKEAMRAVCMEKRDCLCVLPTGFGKSLIFQLVSFTLDYLTKVNTSCVLVVSPLNAIICDQLEKLESWCIGVKVFKQDIRALFPQLMMTLNSFMDTPKYLQRTIL